MLKYLYVILLTSFLLISCSESKSETQSEKILKTVPIDQELFYVANYNIENLFDTKDDVNKKDEWFTPSSEINWTDKRLAQKNKNLAKVIKFMNNGNGPDILGIQEVEHKELLDDLIQNYLDKNKYKSVCFESPDRRGIDNGLIYNSNMFKVVSTDAINVTLPHNKVTRDILHVELESKATSESIHVFVNHWPSRREGLKKSEKNRLAAARVLKKATNSILKVNTNSNIIILGDFNDLPSNISISEVLEAKEVFCDRTNNKDLYNLTYKKFKEGQGTYRYKDHWNMLDQIIISKGLLDRKNIDYVCNSFEIIKPEFVIQKSGKYKGTSMPTYGGRKYLGGYSDHFAVGARFSFKAKDSEDLGSRKIHKCLTNNKI
ncbi:MAG: endonuclease/exonuclease/phosphatase family protein [Ignavibacteriae bacterium]|nr:endonuclease/exonuclease/phosphatase family protein [Ignavibacteriota bacterium]